MTAQDLKETPSQTAGPYLHIGLSPSAAGFAPYAREFGQQIAGPDTPGRRIRIAGRIIDADDTPVRDAIIEIWQADAAGIYPHPDDPRHAQAAPGFTGFGRVACDFETGEWAFETIKPGSVEGPDGSPRAPNLNLWIVARGINLGLSTRLYFGDEEAANATDPLLCAIAEPARRATLIAASTESGEVPAYRFDIRLQGEGETVFLDI
ncbi:protocatechuate 3,4-dioxygenase subunit alpha [Maritimibacter sp. 55A14]|uniref:protocatechuate 3,4-dioxygenase subunit alpha n=1 Tax=Maritimibacter sp. 55A14 TaxID=2174844 RepID=UPI000D61A72B|nr:protocatechuate 3,4-dioxygenase subunit alpha [Maritimibacter sp. 55A14]PWE33452.1 protocatechuate 3,4-dioxygenase subunit alpha [Maritimibacter sp. 55A14]